VTVVEISRNVKAGALVALACLAAGGGAAFAVSKLHSGSASAANEPSALRPGIVARPGDFGFGFDRRRGGLSAAAGYLGLSVDELFTRLRSGQTLAQIAQATSGKSVSGLIAALTEAQKSELDAAVKAGRLSQSQADELTARLSDRITAMVNGQFGFHGRFGDRTRPHDATL
jgi:hypothetical protein